jgi:divalent metal cation (Fe/Co/Zn/Cd) transporter
MTDAVCSNSAGFLISVVILQQGLGLWIGSIGELTDAGVSSRTRKAMSDALQPLLAPSVTSPSLLAVTNLRARRAGSLAFVELTADVPSTLTVSETASLEHKIEHALKEARREVAEVRVQFRPVDQ